MDTPVLAVLVAGAAGFGLGLGVIVGAAIVRYLRRSAKP